jgi:carbonic anhydrase/acetyltransferase-like protein (isoleucine patch superfamily)
MSVKEFPILHDRCKDRPFNFYYFAKKKMALLLTVRGKTPVMGNNAYLAENATLIGDVTMGENCSVWFQAVVRGDVNFIRIGNQVNIQDGAIIHGTFEKCGTTIGNYVSIGHRAIVHGCTLHDHVLVGMGAIIMDKAVVHSNTIIAAGAVVLENTICEPNSIYAGVPAKKVKSITGNTVAGEIARISNNYVQYAAWFKNPDNPHN